MGFNARKTNKQTNTEEVVTYYDVLSRYLLTRVQLNHEKYQTGYSERQRKLFPRSRTANLFVT
jgi:hypothetical protein